MAVLTYFVASAIIRFYERMSDLEGYISRSLYVPELMECLERDWLLCIKHFPWQADESMAEFKEL